MSTISYLIWVCNLIIFFISCTNASKEQFMLKNEDIAYQNCLEGVESHQDKIIRTEESKRIGAKYLNGKDQINKEECVKFCCDTVDCNVFVFEEKNRGTCYLFDCGASDNFKCKFTQHRNYTSGVLLNYRPAMDLEDEIKYTQHEHELANLRNAATIFPVTTKVTPQWNTPVQHQAEQGNNLSGNKQQSEPKNDFIPRGRCSRYQFECRTSGECIAVYNACDGIPQCSDLSDEDPQLGCPTTTLAPQNIENYSGPESPRVDSGTKYSALDSANFIKQTSGSGSSQEITPNVPYNKQMIDNKQVLHSNVQYYPHWSFPINPMYPVNENAFAVNPPIVHGLLPEQPMEYSHNVGNVENTQWTAGQIDNRYAERRQEHGSSQSAYKAPTPSESHAYAQHYPYKGSQRVDTNENFRPPYADNAYYQQHPNVWPFPENDQMNPPAQRVFEPRKMVPIYNYHSESNRNREASRIAKEETKDVGTDKTKENNSITHTDNTEVEITSTAIPKTQETEKSVKLMADDNQQKVKQMKVGPVFLNISEDMALEEYTEDPGGAIISLFLGLCVIGLLIFVLGCRLRGRKFRFRGRKIALEQDSDFLVNGMYL